MPAVEGGRERRAGGHITRYGKVNSEKDTQSNGLRVCERDSGQTYKQRGRSSFD